MHSSNTLFGYRNDRLGGRLANLASTWRIAQKTGAQAFIFWPKPPSNLIENFGDGYRLFNIIDPYHVYFNNNKNNLFLIDENAPSLGNVNSMMGNTNIINGNVLENDVLFKHDSRALYTGFQSLRFKDEMADTVLKETGDLLRRLTPHPKIAQAIEQISEGHDLSQITSMHYRKGDLGKNLARAAHSLCENADRIDDLRRWTIYWLNKSAPLTNYSSYLKKHDRGQHIIFFTDEPSARANFKRAVGRDRVIDLSYLERRFFPIQYAYLEIQIMAKSREIVAAPSGFSDIPAIMMGRHIHNIQSETTVWDLCGEYVNAARLFDLESLNDNILSMFAGFSAKHYRQKHNFDWSELELKNKLKKYWRKSRLRHQEMLDNNR